MSGGGTVAVIVCGIYIADKLGSRIKEVEIVAAMVWSNAGQPLLFGLLGAAVSLDSLSGNVVGNAVLIILIGLVARVIVTYTCTLQTNFNFWERAFTCVSWCPKATVQVITLTLT
jgi:solute carrier family 9B (sodium/hydrogen exchanger), member 1/2